MIPVRGGKGNFLLSYWGRSQEGKDEERKREIYRAGRVENYREERKKQRKQEVRKYGEQ